MRGGIQCAKRGERQELLVFSKKFVLTAKVFIEIRDVFFNELKEKFFKNWKS